MSTTASSRHHTQAPPAVRTHAEHALQLYPELVVPGLENSCQVFALVAESLGQKPAAYNRKTKTKSSSVSRPGVIKHAALVRHVGSTYQPQGLSSREKATHGQPQKANVGTAAHEVKGGGNYTPPVDAKAAEKRRREWVRRLGAVFDFEVTPSAAEKSNPSLAPIHFYVDLYSTGVISLTPPKTLREHSPAKDGTSTSHIWTRRHLITIKISDRDLLAVALGEREPVKLFSAGRLRVKGDIHKALLLGKLLSVTRSQIYADADSESPSHDLYDVHSGTSSVKATSSSERAVQLKDQSMAADKSPIKGDLDGQGMHGQGAPAGGAEWGVGGLGSQDTIRAKL